MTMPASVDDDDGEVDDGVWASGYVCTVAV